MLSEGENSVHILLFKSINFDFVFIICGVKFNLTQE